MNRLLLAGALVAACAATATGSGGLDRPAARADAAFARGEGSMAFGHEEEGRGYLRFEIDDGDVVTGTLLFAAEHHHERFPDVVVRLARIKEAAFSGRTVVFSGPGELHDDPVYVSVRARDGVSRDRFAIECTDAGGETVFEADGELFRGDIEIGGGS
jgi:hypothetical protein